MKYSAALSIVALAATAIAAPSEVEARNGGSCNVSGQKQVCCSGILNCLVQVAGANCNNQAYCCSTSAPVGTLVNVALLNCVNL